MKQFLLCLLGLVLVAVQVQAQPVIIGGSDPLRGGGGNTIRNLRVTEKTADGTEAVLTMEYSYDGNLGASAFVVPVIQKKGEKGVSAWFGADPQTVGRGRGLISVKVRFFNDEPGVPAQLTTDSVRVMLMNSSKRAVITSIPFLTTVQWGSADAKKLAVAESSEKPKTKAQMEAEAEAAKIEASRLKAESEARARQELEKRAQAEAKVRQEAQIKAEAEAKRLAEEKVKAEAEAKRLADERKMAETKAKAEAEKREQERMKAEADAKRLAEEKAAAEAKAKAEAIKREQERLKAEAEAKARAEAEAKLKAAEMAREAELKRLADEKRKAEEMAKAEAEATKRKKLEEEAKMRAAAEEAAKKKAAEEAKKAEEIRLASEAAAKEAARLKAAEEARMKEEAKAQADLEVKQKELEAKIAAVKARIAEAAAEEAKAKALAEAAQKKAQELADASESESKKAKVAEQQKLEAEAKAKAEREAAEIALKKAEEEAVALAKAKEQIKKQAEEAAKLASSATAVIEIPPDIKSQVLNLDVVNRSLDRSEMTIGVEFDYNDKFGSKPLLGVAVAKTGLAEASEYFTAEPMEIKKSRKETVLVPVKFQPPSGRAASFNNYATDRMLIYMADGATAKQVNLFAATMFLVWRPPTAPAAGPGTTAAAPAKAVTGTVEIDAVRQEDVYTGYVTVKYSTTGNSQLRVKLYPKGKPAGAEWFKVDVTPVKQGSGLELFKVAVDPLAKTEYDLINIDVIEVDLLNESGQVIATKQMAQTMSWVKPR
ncbi:MAG TPA: hypothetical protein VGH19_12825 [Verrucomicrobiae bacterium]